MTVRPKPAGKEVPLKIEMLIAALESVSDAVFITDQTGRFVYFNERFVSLHKQDDFKVSVADYSHFLEVTCSDGSALPFELWPVSRALRGESGTRQEYRVSRRDTGESWIGRFNFSPIRDSDGQIIGAVVVGRDITRETTAVQKLKDTEHRARVLMEKSAGVIVSLNLDGTYCFVNDAYAQLLGKTPEQIVGRSVTDLLPPDQAQQRLKALNETVQSRQKQTVELSLRGNDGAERYYLTTAEPICDENDEPQWVLFVAIDITERKLAEDRLRESEIKYRRLFEQNSDALLVFDEKTLAIQDANPTAEALYGYTREEMLQLKITQIATHPYELSNGIETAAGDGSHALPRQAHRKKDGREFPVEMTLTPIQLGGRTVMQAIICDISARRKVEDQLLEISRRLQLATSSARLGIWDWDVKSDTILWDERMHELYGKPKSLGIGRKGVREWAELVHPEDRERVFKECVGATQSKDNVYDTEFRVIHPDNSVVHLRAHGLVVWNEDGVAERMIGTNADITEQKEADAALRRAYSEVEAKVKARTAQLTRESERLRQSEVRLKRAQELGRIGHWSVNFSRDAVDWSDEVYRIFGFEPQSIRPSRELFYSLILPEHRAEARRIVDTAFAQGKSYELTVPFRRPDGSIGIAHSLAEVELDGRGKRYSGVVQDVTEQKTLERELRAAVELRDEFMSIASHELKTPLTALNMRLQLLKKMVDQAHSQIDPRILHMSQGALGSAKALSNLIDDLLDVTRIRAGKLTLSKEDMDLKVVLEKCVHEMQPEARPANTRITLNAPESVTGFWDPARITQIVRNLISNAIKYGRSSPIIVTLTYDSREVCLTVKDSGMGISKELQSQIFERFQRAAPGKITGLGLGLYIVRQIVEAHGGSIRVQSEPDKGSLFTVQLPRTCA